MYFKRDAFGIGCWEHGVMTKWISYQVSETVVNLAANGGNGLLIISGLSLEWLLEEGSMD